MRTTTNTCDWCQTIPPRNEIHVLKAMEECAGSSDREFNRIDMCHICVTALFKGDTVTLTARWKKPK